MNSRGSNACLKMNRLLIILALIAAAMSLRAGDRSDSIVRPVLSAYSIEAGSNHLCNTYLTPLHYSGWRTALSYERMQAMKFNPERFIQRLDLRFGPGIKKSCPQRHYVADRHAPSWSMLWRTRLPHSLTVAAGGTAAADIGMLYLMRNSNNPVAVQASGTIGITAMAAWNGRIGRLPPYPALSAHNALGRLLFLARL